MLTQSELKSKLTYNISSGIFTWIKRNQNIAGTLNGSNYLVIRVSGKSYYAHRLVWLYITGRFPINLIDHINGDRSDNKLNNLREATYQENALNRA